MDTAKRTKPHARMAKRLMRRLGAGLPSPFRQSMKPLASSMNVMKRHMSARFAKK
jgi:hypothetical protein